MEFWSMFTYGEWVGFGISLFLLASLYSSVGHGGGSGYLAVMALFAFPTVVIKPTALVFNIFVSAISFAFFKKEKYFNGRLFYPFALTSIPAAFIGGRIDLDPHLFKVILGIILLLAVWKMMIMPGMKIKRPLKSTWLISLLVGSIIGLLSGMIGIGGGILLSPVILLLGMGNVKEAASISALFILVNSLAGLAGYWSVEGVVVLQTWYFIPVILLGGLLGGYSGSKMLSNQWVKYILSLVLIFAGLKLVFL